MGVLCGPSCILRLSDTRITSLRGLTSWVLWLDHAHSDACTFLCIFVAATRTASHFFSIALKLCFVVQPMIKLCFVVQPMILCFVAEMYDPWLSASFNVIAFSVIHCHRFQGHHRFQYHSMSSLSGSSSLSVSFNVMAFGVTPSSILSWFCIDGSSADH